MPAPSQLKKSDKVSVSDNKLVQSAPASSVSTHFVQTSGDMLTLNPAPYGSPPGVPSPHRNFKISS
jgi:hypothetical protein